MIKKVYLFLLVAMMATVNVALCHAQDSDTIYRFGNKTVTVKIVDADGNVRYGTEEQAREAMKDADDQFAFADNQFAFANDQFAYADSLFAEASKYKRDTTFTEGNKTVTVRITPSDSTKAKNGNKQLNEADKQLARAKKQLTEAKKQLTEAKRQLAEAKKRLRAARRQRAKA